ncbi:Rap/ran-GAP protein [Haplosporangium sp. Z 767]|nr:Rap/ran-GAP protein [Haplosporangium sp. Z 767]
MHSEMTPDNFPDIMETSQEPHPLDHDEKKPEMLSGAIHKRLDVDNHLGVQDLIVYMNRQLPDIPSNPKDASSTTVVANSEHDGAHPDIHSQLVPKNIDISTSSSSIASQASTPTSATNSISDTKSRPSSRLGKLGRFKLPSLSLGNIHRNSKHNSSSFEQDLTATINNSKGASISTSLTMPALHPSSKHSSSFVQGSGSVSTLASANTMGMVTTLGPSTPGSSSHSSISSNHSVLNVNMKSTTNRKTRLALSAFPDDQSHLPHHSPTMLSTDMSEINMVSGTVSSLAPQSILISRQYSEKQPQRHSIKNVGKVFFGSERFTSSTSSNHGQGNGHNDGFKSGLLKRTSRRTVSASHISSKSIFEADGSKTADVGSSNQYEQESGTPIPGRVATSLELETGEIRVMEEDQALVNEEGDEIVGKYLFGNELRHMSFGQADPKQGSGRKTFELGSGSCSHKTKGSKTSPSTMATPSKFPPPARSRLTVDPDSQDETTTPAATVSSASKVLDQTSFSESSQTMSAITSVSKPKPLSPAAVMALATKNARKHEVTPSHSLSSTPPRTVPLSSLTPVASAVKSKFSFMGGSQSNMPSTFTSSVAASTTTTLRNPSVPQLEPKNPVTDYTPIINYKRQRSMSLQDADLLAADQFIALMQDDSSPKRRFSSEALNENAWCLNHKGKRAPMPDPPTTLRSLLCMLKIKCDRALKHLNIAPAPAPYEAEFHLNDDSTLANVGEIAQIMIRVEDVQEATNNEDASLDVVVKINLNNRTDPGRDDNGDGSRSRMCDPDSGTETDLRSDTEKMDAKLDRAEAMRIHFEEVEHVVARMIEFIFKYVCTDQLSTLLKETDRISYLAQEMCIVEMERNRHDTEQQAAEPKDQYIVSKTLGASASANKTTSNLSDDGISEVLKVVSRDRIRHRRSRSHHIHLHQHWQVGSEHGGGDLESEMTHEKQLGIIKQHMFVVPTSGYRIEGRNDLKEIEKALRPDHFLVCPKPNSSIETEPLQPSLLSQAIRVKDESDAGYDRSSTELSDGTIKAYSYGGDASAAPRTTLKWPVSPSFDGEPKSHARTLPESRIGWSAIQDHADRGASSSATATPTTNSVPVVVGGGIGGIGATGACAGIGTPRADMSMLGDYSKEHMGHEAYYYRNWFLGREHRTFVGQVEGLGMVIISIIKDMVVPTDTRPSPPIRFNTGSMPGSSNSSSISYHCAEMNTHSSGTQVSYVSDGTASSTSLSRPELAHSSHSQYSSRMNRNSIGGPGLLGSNRTSSEAMRVILSASAAVVPGAGSSIGNHVSNTLGSEPNTGTTGGAHMAPNSTTAPSKSVITAHQATHHSVGNNNSNAPSRWQYRCILRQKDVDSIRITLPEPEPSPLNNLTRRVGKTQWKTILQSIHPAITQQVVSKLKKVQNNQHFEKELAKFDETMLRFNYKFGVLLVHPGQSREEDWFGNQMASSPSFQEFLESGALGQKVALKGFERFSAGLDTRCETGEYSYYDTWGEGFEIMYHVSTLLPFNTGDRQQIQRKRHIGNDIVCIVFVDGDQPFLPNAIKSQFLHIFVVIHQVSLPDGTRGYSAAIACDEQVPDFGPPLPDPPIFKNPQELRAFLLCKMINGENAAYKAPRLIKPHQRARSGMLENLVAKANTLAKDKDAEKRSSKHQKVSTADAASTSMSGAPSPFSPVVSLSSTMGPESTSTSTNAYNASPHQSHQQECSGHQQDCRYYHHHHPNHQHGKNRSQTQREHQCLLENARQYTFPASPVVTPPVNLSDERPCPHIFSGQKANTFNGHQVGSRNSIVTLNPETSTSSIKTRRNSIADSSKLESMFKVATREAEDAGSYEIWTGGQPNPSSSLCGSQECCFKDMGHIESLLSPEMPLSSAVLPTPSTGAEPLRIDSTSATSSPTEPHFAMSRIPGFQGDRRPGMVSKATTLGHEEKVLDSSSFGVAISNQYKGRSKSELDLLLASFHEGPIASGDHTTTHAMYTDSIASVLSPFSGIPLSEVLQQHPDGNSTEPDITTWG